MTGGTKARVLRIAANILGGPRQLRSFLGVPSASLANWLAGIGEPPHEVFLKALQVILDELDAGGDRLPRNARTRGEPAPVLKARAKPKK